MIVLDAGALVALDRGARAIWADLRTAASAGIDVVVPAAVVAQVWRGSARQARLAMALEGSVIASFDEVARTAGELCGAARTSDVVDASVALAAVPGSVTHLYTSDPADLRHLLATLNRRGVKIILC
jgi:predicted nucleic acid-binding protein